MDWKTFGSRGCGLVQVLYWSLNGGTDERLEGY
jgi:hypothetical protein